MPMLAVNDTQLHYEDTGPGATGETIAFSHGLLWSAGMFAAQIDALRADYRCIAWDHRGQGRSAADDRETIGIELVWQDAVALLDALAPGPVHFAGLSMGGFVALRTAARRPDLVRSLVLIGTSADAEPPENVPRYRLLTRVVRWLGPRVVRSRLAPFMLGRTLCSDPARRAELDRALVAMAGRADIWRAVNGVIDRAPIAGELARVACPATVIVGEEDAATTPAKAARLAGLLGAQVVQIPRAGHSSTVEEPAAVTAAIRAFLATLPAAAASTTVDRG